MFVCFVESVFSNPDGIGGGANALERLEVVGKGCVGGDSVRAGCHFEVELGEPVAGWSAVVEGCRGFVRPNEVLEVDEKGLVRAEEKWVKFAHHVVRVPLHDDARPLSLVEDRDVANAVHTRDRGLDGFGSSSGCAGRDDEVTG